MVRLREVLGLALLMGAGLASGCTTNHDALAKQPPAAGGSGGSAGSQGFSGFGNVGEMGNQAGRDNPDDEILGDDVLTIVHGVVDAPSVRLCFARLDADGLTSQLVGEPMAELGYAASVVLIEEEIGLSFADDAIQPWVLAGDLELLAGLDCEAAVALAVEEEAKVTPVPQPDPGAGGQSAGGAADGPEPPDPPLEMPALRARPVAAIPPGSLNIGRSILMVLSGCLGGAAFFDTIDGAVCGEEYTPETPTLQPVVVKLSRMLSFDAVGLQGVQGSLAVGGIDVRASGAAGSLALTFASGVSFGAIEPRPADVRFSAAELGVSAIGYGLQAVDDSGVLFQDSWLNIREASGLQEIKESRTYTAIFIGPHPQLIKPGWWQQSAFVLVDNDPTRE